MKEFLKQALSSNRSVSLMRILTIFVVVDIMAVWTAACFRGEKIEDIPWGVVAVFTAMITGKAAQVFAEKKGE